MTLTDEQLSTVEEYAGVFLKPSEIAILLNLDESKFRFWCSQKDHPAYLAYQKGFLKSKLEIRKNVVKLAKLGSPQAEELADKYIKDASHA